ncbi:phosphogluconate dehydrogenase (decarboxylating) gnd1 [Mucor velutinosus]|uniref:Phosphogluconate dehydrogenase (Decarboxylating) gnd1 n=1 Tax=Mucor velutinosus TaxID=708070 RepID=A0AAN7D6Z2_9FUNG|nr:phosphogluconate dehydrogenase (decarboxylating) gnd1 [Mucor velutinosus]
MRRTTKSTAKTAYRSKAAAPFDLSTVKTKSQELAASASRKSNRLFGIEEAPTFYPTQDEFRDPLRYIEKISPEGEKYGIIKIVPPKDYNPDFSLKTESFRFKTRIQKLNSMEGETRTNVNYLEQIKKYHKLTGKSITKLPQLDKRPIDLYKLKNEVAARGGVQEVTRLKKWAEIGRELGYARKQCTSMSNALKTAYQKVVLPYEIWYGKHKNDIDQFTLKEDNGSSSSPTDSTENDNCEICHKNGNEDSLLLCDGCNRGFHTYCLNPPLPSVPKTDWFCFQCLTAVGKDYGFEDGNEYSLNDFHTVCDNFKTNWFKKTHPKGSSTVTEEECESEFWRLVNNPYETCQVEYGADLHSTQHGSGFATADHLSKSALDPWNLNVIPVVPQSLFTYIKSDISGMMVPWLYVGMCFSAFCWHNEDHYTYSINYMHWGETKTWYGVPGSDTAKFEDAMRKAVPELFEQQPDLLFQLVTMLSPERLKKENVNVYAVDQRPGQFVITYPKAYHSGFNHGFNFCEAVNFAPSEWVDYGLECAKSYKNYRRQPCFSHDNLLVTAARNLNSMENIDWLKRGLLEMQSREMEERQHVRARKLEERVVPEADIREELQCVFCNCYSYLSYIGCDCTHKIACLEHVAELCTCDINSKVMHLQFTDSQLEELVLRVTHIGPTPDLWIEKLDTVLNSRTGLNMKKLREFIRDAHNSNVPQEPIDNLKEFINVLDRWIADAERLLGSRPDNAKQTETRYERCQDLMERAQEIGFNLALLPNVESYAAKLKDVDDQITDELFASNDIDRQKSILDRGVRFRSDSAQFRKLKKFMEYSVWEQALRKLYAAPFAAKNYKRLIKDGEEMGLTVESDALFKHLVDKDRHARQAVQHVENIIKGREKIDPSDEQGIFHIGYNAENPDISVDLDPQLFNRLRNSITRSKITLGDLDTMLNTQCTNASIAERPSVSEAQRLTTATRELCYTSDLATRLTAELARNSAWNEKLRSTLMNGRQKGLEVVLKEILTNVQRITTSEEDTPKIYCICRSKENGHMIACEICHEWYHVPCLRVARNIARSLTAYHCPACHPTPDALQKIAHQSKQPTLKEIADLVAAAGQLSFRPKDYEAITDIYNIMLDYQSRVQAFCRSKEQLDHTDVKRIKFYLRTLMGLEVLLPDETDFLRAKIKVLAPAVEPIAKSTPSSPTSSSNISPPKVSSAVNHASSAYHNKAIASSPTPSGSSSASSPMDHAQPEKPSLKRKLITTVGSSPIPERPAKAIKLTLKPPKPITTDQYHHPVSSPSSASSSSSSGKKRKHKWDDDGYKPSKKLK